MTSTLRELVSNAERCADALRAGNLALVGRCASAYWAQKKRMAAGCEPIEIGRALALLREEKLIHGGSLAGAGGGGFMYLVSTAPGAEGAAAIRSALLGAAAGLAQRGLVPIVEVPYAKYLDCGFPCGNQPHRIDASLISTQVASTSSPRSRSCTG